MFFESILHRRDLRSDRIWASPLLFHEPFRRVPFYLDTWALLKSQYWPHEKIDKLSSERFAETVRHASQIPFWKERFAKAGIDPRNFHENDIARIPILSKKDFLDRDIAEYTVPELLPKSREYHTSGSTGRPLNFYHDQQFELRSSAVSERMFLAAGDGRRFPVIFMKSRLHMGFNFAKYYFFFLRGYNSVRHRVQELEKLISSFPGEVIVFGLGSSLLELARVCQELHLSLPLHCVLATGEKLSDFQRREIEKALRTRVRVSYGMSEIRRLGFECARHRIHLNEESVYFEITDDNGTPLPPGGKGRLVVTGFENHVMPFIRYDTGDIAVISKDPCPCERTLRTIEFHGRQVKLLHVGNGRTVSLLDFSFLFDTYHEAVRQFQIIRTGEYSFLVRIVKGTRFKGEKTKLTITEQFKTSIHPKTEIQWEIVNSIPEGPNGKALYFIDKFEKNP